jgi:hypothetical protein
MNNHHVALEERHLLEINTHPVAADVVLQGGAYYKAKDEDFEIAWYVNGKSKVDSARLLWEDE